MRLFKLPRRTSDRPQDDVDAKWDVCAPDVVREFSAVGYYFGLELHKRLGVPVGLIMSAWGGTAIEPWTPPIGFASVPEVKPLLEAQAAKYAEYRNALAKALPSWETWIKDSRKALAAKSALPPSPVPRLPANPYDDPQAPTTLYNGMIHALTPFAIRGAIWYQGEANRNDGLFYEKKMEALIDGWRAVWQIGDFPFYYVQLAPFNYGYDRETPVGDVPDFLRLPLIWEAQRNVLRIPNTGMAVIDGYHGPLRHPPAEQARRRLPAVAVGPGQRLRREDARVLGPALQRNDRRGGHGPYRIRPRRRRPHHQRRPGCEVVRDRRRGPRLLQGRGRDRRGHGRRLEPAGRRRPRPCAWAGTSWPCPTWPTGKACPPRPSEPTTGDFKRGT
ncbi:MAG: sialate O-acetylesterase [Marinilabiliales bacterium]|nr:sialate O-acetylesterase [Marinilabiliales bacterium]